MWLPISIKTQGVQGFEKHEQPAAHSCCRFLSCDIVLWYGVAAETARLLRNCPLPFPGMISTSRIFLSIALLKACWRPGRWPWNWWIYRAGQLCHAQSNFDAIFPGDLFLRKQEVATPILKVFYSCRRTHKYLPHRFVVVWQKSSILRNKRRILPVSSSTSRYRFPTATSILLSGYIFWYNRLTDRKYSENIAVQYACMKIIDDHHVADIRSAVNQEVDFIEFFNGQCIIAEVKFSLFSGNKSAGLFIRMIWWYTRHWGSSSAFGRPWVQKGLSSIPSREMRPVPWRWPPWNLTISLFCLLGCWVVAISLSSLSW